MQKTKDIELIEQAKQGDMSAFENIVDIYQAQVARTVIGMLGKGEDAEDIGQEVFIQLYRSLDKYRGDSSLGTYLTRIAINLSINALNKQKRQIFRRTFLFNKEYEDSNELQNIPNQNNEHESRDIQELVQMALSKIDPKFRSVIVLRMMDGYSTKETAKTLNLPIGTVLSRLTRAQEKFKFELKKLGYENTDF